MKDMKLCITGSFGNHDIGDEAMLTVVLDFLISDCGIPRNNIDLFGWQPDYMSWFHKHPIENCHRDSLLSDLMKWETDQVRIQEKQKQEEAALRRLRTCWSYRIKSLVRAPLHAIKRTWQAPQTTTTPSTTSNGSTEANLEPIKQIVDHCDGLVVTGGGTINTRDKKGASIHRMAGLTASFAKKKKPIFFCAQTIGPLGFYPSHDRLAKEMIGRADWLFARDNRYSRRYLEALGEAPDHFVETYDDASTLAYEDASLPQEVVDFLSKRRCIALNITLYTADTDQKRYFLAQLAESLLEKYDSNLLFVGHTPWDFFTLQGIWDMVDNQYQDRILVPDTRYWHDTQLKKAISLCQLAIGGRYHFLVFAGTTDTPFVGMSGIHYSYIKNDGFARIFGFEDFVLDERRTWDLDCVLATAEKAMETEFDITNRLERPSPTMKALQKWLSGI